MAQMIALVTGANKGIGKEVSRQLAAKQILVLMGARDRERGEKAVADLKVKSSMWDSSEWMSPHISIDDDVLNPAPVPTVLRQV